MAAVAVGDTQHDPVSASDLDVAYVVVLVARFVDTAEVVLGCLLAELVAVAGIANNPVAADAKLAAVELVNAASIADKPTYRAAAG